MIIKVCGITDYQNAIAISLLSIDILGLIFYPGSKRFVTDNHLGAKIKEYNPEVKICGVFVNPSQDEIQNKMLIHHLDFLQIYALSDLTMLNIIKSNFPTVKIILAQEVDHFMNNTKSISQADLLLVDSASPSSNGLYGGSGKKFNWQILNSHLSTKPFILSGGISESNIQQIFDINNPSLVGIDLNSQFEKALGIKDLQKLNDTLIKFRNYENRL